MRTTNVIGTIKLLEGREIVSPGDHLTMVVTLIQPVAIGEGLRFVIRETERTVGVGVISRIVT